MAVPYSPEITPSSNYSPAASSPIKFSFALADPSPSSVKCNSPSENAPQPESPPPPPRTHVPNTGAAIIAGIVGGAAVVAAVAACLFWLFMYRRRSWSQNDDVPPHYLDPERPPKGDSRWNEPGKNSPEPSEPMTSSPPSPGSLISLSSSFSGHSPKQPVRQFTYEELAIATNGFSELNLLGQGMFGDVYKGILSDGSLREVAVKRLNSGDGGDREFQSEVENIGSAHHRHIVSLVGYCIGNGQKMLVYHFIPNNNLECHLHEKGQPPMDWTKKVRVAAGLAKGLAYLHRHPAIIHGDVKATNIFLDGDFEAMVGDFGLAKLLSADTMGTSGYLAPERAGGGKLTKESDVFSFGVVLLELITGRRAVDSDGNYLVEWARPILVKALEEKDFDEMIDSRVGSNYNVHELEVMATCAAACIHHSDKRRPKMTQIVDALDDVSIVKNLRKSEE
ncbi:proline-rich receptor-like protein kinase PERK1 isoform X2 [Andrographis paniculata]|uniref:proline-rich receptor-like protein kinase PERK1 isoform X2 n=1 Tax=Andrographis paniculata TaxID=175694 RepID=UPI0021E893D4|nr:proline-rich receptor-like protein kinase PERK1 isoform X2 [Andrographis paniculata]